MNKVNKKRVHEVSEEKLLKNIGNIDLAENKVKFNFAKRFGNLIANNEIEQKTITAELHIPESTISDYRNGKTEPKISTLAIIANFFDVSSDFLLGISNTESRNVKSQNIENAIGLTDNTQQQLRKLKDNQISKDIINAMFKEDMVIKLVDLIKSNIEFSYLYNRIEEVQYGNANNLQETLIKFRDYVKWQETQKINEVVEKVTTQILEDLPQSFIEPIENKFNESYNNDNVKEEITMIKRAFEELSIFRNFVGGLEQE